MVNIINAILHEMSDQDLKDAEYVIEYLFKDLKLDVVWSVTLQRKNQR